MIRQINHKNILYFALCGISCLTLVSIFFLQHASLRASRAVYSSETYGFQITFPTHPFVSHNPVIYEHSVKLPITATRTQIAASDKNDYYIVSVDRFPNNSLQNANLDQILQKHAEKLTDTDYMTLHALRSSLATGSYKRFAGYRAYTATYSLYLRDQKSHPVYLVDFFKGNDLYTISAGNISSSDFKMFLDSFKLK